MWPNFAVAIWFPFLIMSLLLVSVITCVVRGGRWGWCSLFVVVFDVVYVCLFMFMFLCLLKSVFELSSSLYFEFWMKMELLILNIGFIINAQVIIYLSNWLVFHIHSKYTHVYLLFIYVYTQLLKREGAKITSNYIRISRAGSLAGDECFGSLKPISPPYPLDLSITIYLSSFILNHFFFIFFNQTWALV